VTTKQTDIQIETFSDNEVVVPKIVKRRGQADKITANFSKRSTFKWVPFNLLRVDFSYQRKIQAKKVVTYAHTWDQELLGTLVVSHRKDGFYYIIDGAHRFVALSLIENHPNRMWCEAFEGLTYEEECVKFHNLDNYRDNLTPGASFRALAQGKVPIAVEITAAVNKAGMTVDYSRGPVAGNVRAYKTLQSIYKRSGSNALTKILRVCHGAWPTHTDAANAAMMLGLEIFLDKYEDQITEKALIETLSKYDPAFIVNQGRSIKGTMSSSIYSSVAMAIRSLYNKKRTTKRLPEGI
jgi:hypothetical protein